MAKQNFIAKILCRLGGDSFTQESTNASLERVLRDAQKSTAPSIWTFKPINGSYFPIFIRERRIAPMTFVPMR